MSAQTLMTTLLLKWEEIQVETLRDVISLWKAMEREEHGCLIDLDEKKCFWLSNW